MARKERPPETACSRLPRNSREFQMPRPIFTNSERTEFTTRVLTTIAILNCEMRTDLPRF